MVTKETNIIQSRVLQPPPLELVVPTLEQVYQLEKSGQIDQLSLQKIHRLKERWTQASQIVAICGEFGLGDSILDLRYAILTALKTDKPVICQVHVALLPITDILSKSIPNLRCVGRVEPEIVFDSKSFLIKFEGGDLAMTFRDWLAQTDMLPSTIMEQLQKLGQNDQIGYWYFFTQSLHESTYSNFDQEHLIPDCHPQESDFDSALMLCMLGMEVSSHDIETHPAFAILESQLSQLNQNFDVLILPDAKEFPTSDRSRSIKSCDLSIWELYFAELRKKTNCQIAIVRGVSHPQYCAQVIQLAIQHGIHVEEIEGNLLELGKHMLRAKKIIGMDSGTSHLALDVIRFAKLHGLSIDFISMFCNLAGLYKRYGIVGKKTFLISEDMTQEEQQRAAQFMLGTN